MAAHETYEVPGGGPAGRAVTVLDLAGHANSYRMAAICMNCKWEGQVRIARGERATRGIAAKGYECPLCDCATVEPTKVVARDTPENDSRDDMAKYLKSMEDYHARLRF